MTTKWKRCLPLAAMILFLMALGLSTCFAQDPANSPAESRKGLMDFIRAGGWVGAAIILLSFVGTAVVIEGFLHVKAGRLLPQGLIDQATQLAHKGRFSEMLNLCRASDSMLSRILQIGLDQGTLGLPAVRQAMQEQGVKEITRLNQRVSYLGLIASVAPMLGLLGTVTGMIGSFDILGQSKGAARPDELAVGIAEALVTTCEGLILAVPLMFFHSFFRDRITRIGQEASTLCDRLLRVMGKVIETNLAAKTAGAANGAPAGVSPTLATSPE